MTIDLDDFSDAEPMALVPVAPNAAALTVTPPTLDVSAIALTDTVEAFKQERDSFVAHHKGFVVNSPENLEYAGSIIDTCIATKRQVDGVFEKAVSYFFKIHRSLTGLRGELTAPLESLEKSLRDQTVAYRQRVAEQERQARIKAQAEAAAKAAAEKAEQDRIARAAAAEAAEAAAAAKATADAAAAAGNLDAAMEAESHAEAAAASAEVAAQEAEAQEAAPVYVPPPVMAEPVLAKGAGGSTLVDKWIAEVEEDEATTVKAIIAGISENPSLVGLLMLNTKAIDNLVGKSLKGEARIPGMRIVNKPIDRRLGARGK